MLTRKVKVYELQEEIEEADYDAARLVPDAKFSDDEEHANEEDMSTDEDKDHKKERRNAGRECLHFLLQAAEDLEDL